MVLKPIRKGYTIQIKARYMYVIKQFENVGKNNLHSKGMQLIGA